MTNTTPVYYLGRYNYFNDEPDYGYCLCKPYGLNLTDMVERAGKSDITIIRPVYADSPEEIWAELRNLDIIEFEPYKPTQYYLGIYANKDIHGETIINPIVIETTLETADEVFKFCAETPDKNTLIDIPSLISPNQAYTLLDVEGIDYLYHC